MEIKYSIGNKVRVVALPPTQKYTFTPRQLIEEHKLLETVSVIKHILTESLAAKRSDSPSYEIEFIGKDNRLKTLFFKDNEIELVSSFFNEEML